MINSRTTALVMFACLVALGIWDIGAVVLGGVDATISAVITNLAGNHPYIAFWCGLLTAHFFGLIMIPRKTDGQ